LLIFARGRQLHLFTLGKKSSEPNSDLGRVLPGIAQWRQQMPCRFAEAQGNDHWCGEGWTTTEENKHSTRQPYLLQINARCAFEGCRTTNILATGHRQDQALYKRKKCGVPVNHHGMRQATSTSITGI